jgi:hypothetical protein
MSKAEITTVVWGSGCIEQSVYTTIDDTHTQLERSVMDTRIKQTATALKLLGWRPTTIDYTIELSRLEQMLKRVNRCNADREQIEHVLDTTLRLLNLRWD